MRFSSLEQLGRLGHRNPWQGRRHVHQRALVEGRHELRAELPRRPEAEPEDGHRSQDRQGLGAENAADHRTVERDQAPIDRVAALRNDPSLDEDDHQGWDERHRQERRGCHGEGLGEGERPEQATLLRFQGEDRQERDGDDEQAEEQRRADLASRLDQDLDAWLVRLSPFQVLVGVLDHDDGGVDHRADGDGDAAEAHDVGAKPQRLHRREGHQDADRQHDDRHQGAAQMQKEHDADQRDDDALLDQRAL
ncbi:hypothetical protein BTHI11S_04872 [Bosea thiooxidans]